MNMLSDAQVDFEHVLRLDPKNSDANRELLIVVDRIVVNPNGKRVAFSFVPLSSVKNGKKPLLSVDGTAKSFEASCSSSCSAEPMITEVNSGQGRMVFDTISPSNPPPVDEYIHPGLHPFPLPRNLQDTLLPIKGELQKKLHISSKDYSNLLAGKDLSFFHVGSLSFMRVRPLIPENSIQTGTPHEDNSRAAEVPRSSPLHKEHVQHSTLVLDNNKLVQEDVVFEIAKKKRISSASAQISMVSTIQFQFSAVEESTNKSCRSKMANSYLRSREIQASLRLRKRFSISVNFSNVFCSFPKKDAVAKRMKRKDTSFFQFDDLYHPPYKKYRLTVYFIILYFYFG